MGPLPGLVRFLRTRASRSVVRVMIYESESEMLSASFLLQRTIPINRMRALALWPNGLGFQEFAADGGFR